LPPLRSWNLIRWREIARVQWSAVRADAEAQLASLPEMDWRHHAQQVRLDYALALLAELAPCPHGWKNVADIGDVVLQECLFCGEARAVNPQTGEVAAVEREGGVA